jgi:hypothetical protein
MCGYEYISNIVLSPLVGIVYYEVKWKTSLKQIILKSIQVIAASIFGFIIAIFIHLGELWLYTGSIKDAINAFSQLSHSRTVAGFSGHAVKKSHLDTFDMAVKFLQNNGLNINTNSNFNKWLIGLLVGNYWQLQYRHWFLFIKNSYLIIFMTITSLLYIRSSSRKIKATALSLLLAVPISLSWGILASPHHLVHLHLNSITYHLPLYLFGFVAVPFLFWRGKLLKIW